MNVRHDWEVLKNGRYGIVRLLLLVATAGGFYYYGFVGVNPATIENAMYVDSRIDVEIPGIGRRLEYVLLGEMASNEDC